MTHANTTTQGFLLTHAKFNDRTRSGVSLDPHNSMSKRTEMQHYPRLNERATQNYPRHKRELSNATEAHVTRRCNQQTQQTRNAKLPKAQERVIKCNRGTCNTEMQSTLSDAQRKITQRTRESYQMQQRHMQHGDATLPKTQRARNPRHKRELKSKGGAQGHMKHGKSVNKRNKRRYADYAR